MSEFSELKAEYLALTGKSPPPMSTDAIRAKVAELKAAAASPPQADPVVDQAQPEQAARAADAEAAAAASPPQADPVVDQAQPEQGPPAADANLAEQPIEEACAECGIAPDADGNVSVELLVSLAGEQVKAPGDEHACAADEAVRLIRAGIAKPRG